MTNAPPLHPNCRSTISGSLKGPGSIKTGTRIARADNGKTYHIPADMSYGDWKAVYVDKTINIGAWKEKSMSAENNNNSLWPNSGILISKKEYTELIQYAQDKGITLQGFKKYDGDITLAKEFIDRYSLLKEKYPIPEKYKEKLALKVDYQMNQADFAATNTYIIKLNGMIMRDREKLSKEYGTLVKERWFTQGTSYINILDHEFGHLFMELNKISPQRVTKIIMPSATNLEILSYVKQNLSRYSAQNSNFQEIPSEVFSEVAGEKPSEFSLKFVEECHKIILERG